MQYWFRALLVVAAVGLVPPAVCAQSSQPPPTSPPSSTQPADPQPPTYKEEVKVTAEKWESDASKVPLSLTVVRPEDLAVSGASLLNQIGPYVPGLFLRNDGDRSFNKPSLRGITSSPFNDPAVSVYIDDVPVDPRMGLATPLSNVERIEVVRGPHGVIWGRNTSGGVMHVVTALPAAVWQSSGGVSVGTFGEVVAPFSVQGPIADRVFFGVSGMYDHRTGYLTNPVNPEIVDRRNGAFARVNLRWVPTAAWDVQLRSDTGVWRDGGFLASPNGAVDPYEVRSNTDSYENSQVIQQSLRLRRDGPRASLVAVAARRQVSVYRISDEDLTSSPVREETWSDLHDTRWTGEVRLVSPEARRTRWLVGAFAGTRDATDVYETFLPVIFQGYSDRNGATYEDRTFALFGQVATPVGSHVRVTTGARVDVDRKQMNRADRFYGLPTPTPADDAVAPAFSLTRDFTFFSPRVSVDVALSPSTMVFAGLARGVRSGGFNFTTDNPALATFGGEFVLSVEGGLKGRWAGGRAEAAATVYRSFITDLQFQQFVAGFFAVANAGEASARGVELEGAVRPGAGLTVRGNYAFTSATLDQFNNGFADLSGNGIPAVPRFTLLTAVDWAGPRGLEVGAELIGNGKVFFDEANVSSAAAYSVVNLRAGIRRDRWAVHAYARNAGGSEYSTMIVPFFYQVPGAPRRFGVSLSVFTR